MSLRNLYDQSNNQYVFPTVDASVLEINNVPISTGGVGTQNLQQVLNTGSDGGNQSITNLNNVSLNGYLILNRTLNTIQLNTGSNSWQIVSSGGSILLQNYINSNLVSSSFQIDGNGNIFLGTGSNPTPMVYVYGNRGESRVYDTLYNPVPTSDTGMVFYNKSYNVTVNNKILQPVLNTGLGNTYVNICQLNPTTDFEGSTHFKININTMGFSTNIANFESFYFTLYVIDNKIDLTTLTMNDINKNQIIYTNTITSNNSNTFTLSDLNLEFYDNSGINSMNIIGLVDYSGFNVYLTSCNFTVNSDNGTYNYLPTQTTFP